MIPTKDKLLDDMQYCKQLDSGDKPDWEMQIDVNPIIKVIKINTVKRQTG